METKKNSIKERAKRGPNGIKKKVKAKISPIKREISFTGSLSEHKDGSIFLFIDIQNDQEGNTAKNLSLNKAEVVGLKKFVEFLDLG